MPGLLQSPDVHAAWKLGAAFVAEFLGVTLFALYGEAVPPEWGPWGNGLSLAVLSECSHSLSQALDWKRQLLTSAHAIGAGRCCPWHAL